jgi:hypothetical protein
LVVKFGQYPAKILESYDNLIVCMAPAIPELTMATEAVVTILSKNSGEEACDITLRYLYTV